ncbi:hypothetical protein DYBT9275_03179 [Dyadobacter sp. CECT 9275]|uniref:Water stress and hypersensitive response domain-containing protein n=1 Tax=Dyadobacter helix TaxID=2822344 RepID=A0A916JD32_9BACT|nr:LEA type 2 family protein [Dyadobacter sp. CECT 9275]CAG5003563.1 hypothetical protein DYBT9275_03179 [Dyadobacter sp. CECT 9275]
MRLTRTARNIVIIMLVLLVAGGAFYFYKSKKGNPVSGLKPRVEMGIGHITNITSTTVDLSLDLLIHNPLPMGFDVKEFTYFVQMNGVTIVESEHKEPLLIKSNDSTIITLPSQLNIRKLSNEGEKEAARGEDSASYHFEGLFHLRKPFLGKDTIRLAFDKRMPLYRLPKVKILGYDMEKFRLSESEIVIKLEFTNQNPFTLQFKDPSYAVDLGKQKRLADGNSPGSTKVPGKSSEIYEIPLKINMKDLLKAAGQLIGQGKSLPFTLYFKSRLVSENDVFKNSDVNLIVDGELKDLDKVKKNLGN